MSDLSFLSNADIAAGRKMKMNNINGGGEIDSSASVAASASDFGDSEFPEEEVEARRIDFCDVIEEEEGASDAVDKPADDDDDDDDDDDENSNDDSDDEKPSSPSPNDGANDSTSTAMVVAAATNVAEQWQKWKSEKSHKDNDPLQTADAETDGVDVIEKDDEAAAASATGSSAKADSSDEPSASKPMEGEAPTPSENHSNNEGVPAPSSTDDVKSSDAQYPSSKDDTAIVPPKAEATKEAENQEETSSKPQKPDTTNVETPRKEQQPGVPVFKFNYEPRDYEHVYFVKLFYHALQQSNDNDTDDNSATPTEILSPKNAGELFLTANVPPDHLRMIWNMAVMPRTPYPPEVTPPCHELCTI